ncbi:hypothetical protein NYE80_09940 [Paenibacillus sp. FSL H7-0357]|uniref:hypothetical protein n=1 Tax=Paenibacillus sp. FSL H7-0357 TaxID=1536774 RepID=UPI0030D59504
MPGICLRNGADARGESAAGDEAGASGLRDLYLRDDRKAERDDDYTPERGAAVVQRPHGI